MTISRDAHASAAGALSARGWPRCRPRSRDGICAFERAAVDRQPDIGFVIDWPVTFTVRGGRVFTVARGDAGDLRIRVEGGGEWQSMGRHHTPTIGAVVGGALRWWYDSTGERLFLVKPDH